MDPVIRALVEARIEELRRQADDYERQRVASLETAASATVRRDEVTAEADQLSAALGNLVDHIPIA